MSLMHWPNNAIVTNMAALAKNWFDLEWKENLDDMGRGVYVRGLYLELIGVFTRVSLEYRHTDELLTRTD